MGLFIPTSRTQTATPFSEINLLKGRLTNLDNNEFIGFQFNPEALRYEQEFLWSELKWRGSEHGGDLAYKGSGAIEFELPLRFVSDPAAPEIESQTQRAISTRTVRVDFEALEATLQAWVKPITGKGRPSRVNISFGAARFFNVVIKNLRVEITAFHADLTAREALLTLECREWLQKQ